jgi:hypothetical protein
MVEILEGLWDGIGATRGAKAPSHSGVKGEMSGKVNDGEAGRIETNY